MGLIRAAVGSVSGGLADQWLEVIEPAQLTNQTLMTKGVAVRKNDKRNSNKKGTSGVITDGSVIHVYPNTAMMIMDGGKMIDFTAEEGYYTLDNPSSPSVFSGNLKGAIDESFKRFKFGGTSPQNMEVVYINLQEMTDIKFGTRSPINYFDNFYNAELFVRAHGSYSIRVTDPILFYNQVLSKSASHVEVSDLAGQFLDEFLSAFQTAIGQLSVEGFRVSQLASKSSELSHHLADVLDQEWGTQRGLEIVSVGVASISYDDDSKALIQMRNKGAMLSDAQIREGFVQGSIASGIEKAGENPNGSAATFMGMGAGLNTAGGFMSEASKTNREQAAQQASSGQDEWRCPNDQTLNTGKFCSECGEPRPTATTAGIKMRCSACQEIVTITDAMPKFCPECGKPFSGTAV
ncbi:SPFH domain-containing protein [Vagococcus lutrae]|uniref:SPFH domain-containing protein n=1 Tax=Vagococcus lutrae TaxID=81947 RepID=UPI001443C825|nr:SPFH domain-containing protein [Vagococcus lutrae]MDT2806380.1 SPFH domain-containing protein [Vagococcus lutrae]MDT2816612.1 SPFH domain-containing protein [Vagococcus lutrae]MDT2825914.1 SPFH domain-containing protein [Vagococcus lutrae]MDT2841176.1 SPFH domain-containing protein [Vagococcus lutrae]NKZ28038.1 virion core protein [Vagococcus lutrae]